ncbi:carbohydrate ABC transporter membrane protein 1, CUT1 family [Candidatus Vecturithrix granuli]|uniref:Carbohydrate ABC transporter membrane protein 1, CUT1 family n=1 Tax=Vecturithrix granuli TaxID=1499967 RepID=A0A081C1P4_VECG1|nr:carbohydrate ABC transporter membrane protein 1, CUT1 family [Candidatus Vecturithrix granuli]
MVKQFIQSVNNIFQSLFQRIDNLSEAKYGYLLVSPSIILLSLIVVMPVGYVVYLSFCEFDITMTPTFVGLQNYTAILHNSTFYLYLKHSGEYVLIGIGSAFLGALIIALALNEITRYTGLFRTFNLWPWGIPPVVATLMWKWILNDTNGVLNQILVSAGILRRPVAWLSSPSFTMEVLALVHAWTVIPFIMVILLAGLQSVPDELYEASAIDGASVIDRFRYITFQFLKPAMMSSLMIATIFAFRTFDIVFTLTGGGPGESTEMMVTYIYEKAFRELQLGYASALSVIMVIISFGIVAFFTYIFRTETE